MTFITPLPTKDVYIRPVWGPAATQDVIIRPQANEITKSLVVRVALNKWTLVVEKGRRLPGVFGSGKKGVNHEQIALPE